LSERLGDAGLLQHAIGCVPGFYFVIDREFSVGHRAVPDFVVVLALPVKSATVCPQDPFDLGREVRHSGGAQADSLFVLNIGEQLD
jgi:hypothetical protein